MTSTTDSTSPEVEPFKLCGGDPMSQKEFHELYTRLSDDIRMELIGGIVRMMSPLKWRHGAYHTSLSSLLFAYEGHTLGVECGDNVTILLGNDSEPQPDLVLRILPEYGGRSHTDKDGYVAGAPELVIEIADSSHAIDLHAKREDYQRHGVREYLVVNLREQRLHWFDLPDNRERLPDEDDVYRLSEMPGLWIHGGALWERNYRGMMSTLERGLASEEHGDFVDRLARFRGS